MKEKTKNNEKKQEEKGHKDPAGLLFSGKIKIFDAKTGEILVEQRSD